MKMYEVSCQQEVTLMSRLSYKQNSQRKSTLEANLKGVLTELMRSSSENILAYRYLINNPVYN